MSFLIQVDDTISLRLIEPHHAEEIFAVVDANREHLRPWLPWVDPTTEVSVTRTWAEGAARRFGERRDVPLSILEDGRVVGGVGLHQLDSANHSAEVGYWLAADAQGRGIMTRCVAKVLGIAFEERGMHRVHLHAMDRNARSRAVAERLAFTLEGELREAIFMYEGYHTIVIYGLLADEWRASRE